MTTTIENKRRELIENVENTISKIQKTNTVFDLDFLENCKNKEDFENLHIIFDNNGLNILLKETDFSKEDVVDFVLIKYVHNCSLKEFFKLNQDKEFVDSVIESLEKYKKKLIGLEKTDEFDCGLYNADYEYELYDYGDIPYSIATNGQRLHKIFCNRRYPEVFWEIIWRVSFHNDRLPYLDSDNFREFIIEEAMRANVYSYGFVRNLDEFLEKVQELDLEDGLDDFFYSIVNIVSDWSF